MGGVWDLVTDAGAAPEPVRRRLVDAAVAAAVDRMDLVHVLEALCRWYPEDRPTLTATADRLFAAVVADPTSEACLVVARVRVGHLDDRAGARAALDVSRHLLSTQALCAGWQCVQLAEAYATLLDDRDTALECLYMGVDKGRAKSSVDDLCRVATVRVVALEPAQARALVAEAQALAIIPHHVHTVVEAWRALGADEDADRLLADATARVTSPRDALQYAQYYSSHDDPVGIARELRRARGLAGTAEDWIRIAETTFVHGQPAADVRTALERATLLASVRTPYGAIVRSGIARGYRLWLNDADAADRVGPAALPPQAFRVHRRTLAGWPSSPDALLDWLRPRLTDQALTDIATTDYGYHIDEHLAAMKDIRDHGRLPWQWEWCPAEVLGLTYASAPDALQRAWSTTLLCIGPQTLQELGSLAPQLVAACLELGGPAPDLAEALLAWIAETDPVIDDDDGSEDGDTEEEPDGDPMALLALLILRTATDPGDTRIGPLADTIPTRGSSWHCADDLRHALDNTTDTVEWDDLIDRILVPARRRHPPLDRLLDQLHRPTPERTPRRRLAGKTF